MGRRLLRSSLRKPWRSRQCKKYLCSCCSEEKSKPSVRTPFISHAPPPKLRLKKRPNALKKKQKPTLKSKNSTVKLNPRKASFLDEAGQNCTEVRLCESVYVSVARLKKSVLDSLSDKGTVCLSEGDSLSHLLKPEENSGLTNSNLSHGNTDLFGKESSSVMDRLRVLNVDWLSSPRTSTANQSKPLASRTVPVVPQANMKSIFLEDQKSSGDESFKENVKTSREDSDPDVIILDGPRNFQPRSHVGSPTTSGVRRVPFGPTVPLSTVPGTSLKEPGQLKQRVGATLVRGPSANKAQLRSLLKPRETVSTALSASNAPTPLLTANRQSPRRIINPYSSAQIQPHEPTPEKGCYLIVKPKETSKPTPLNFNEVHSSIPLKNCQKSLMTDVIDSCERSSRRPITQLPSSILKKKSSSSPSDNNTSSAHGIFSWKKMPSVPGSSRMFKSAASNRVSETVNTTSVIRSDKNVLTIVVSDSSDDECSLVVDKPARIKPHVMNLATNSKNVRDTSFHGLNPKKIVKGKTSEPANKKNSSRSKSTQTRPKKNAKSGSNVTSKKAASKSCCLGCRIETPRRRNQSRVNVSPDDSDSSLASESGDAETDPDDPTYSNNGSATSRRAFTSDPCKGTNDCDSTGSSRPLDATPSSSIPRRYQLRSSSLTKKRKHRNSRGRKPKFSSSQLKTAKAKQELEKNHEAHQVEDGAKCDDTPEKEKADVESNIVFDEMSRIPPKISEAEVIAIEDIDATAVDIASENGTKEKEVLDSDSVSVPENTETQMSDPEDPDVVLLTSVPSEGKGESADSSRCLEKLVTPMSNRVENRKLSEKESPTLSTDQIRNQGSSPCPRTNAMTFTEAFIASLYNTKVSNKSQPEPAASNALSQGQVIHTSIRSPEKRKLWERVGNAKIKETRSSVGNNSSISPPVMSIADTYARKTGRKSSLNHPQVECGLSNEGTISDLRPQEIVNSASESALPKKPSENTVDLQSSFTDNDDSSASQPNALAGSTCKNRKIPSLHVVSFANGDNNSEPQKNLSTVDYGDRQFRSEHSLISPGTVNTETDHQETFVPERSSDLPPDCSQVSEGNIGGISDSQENLRSLGDTGDFHLFPPETISSLLEFTENEVVFESHGDRIDEVGLESLEMTHPENSCAVTAVCGSLEDHNLPVIEVSNSQDCQGVIENLPESSAGGSCASIGVSTIGDLNCMTSKEDYVGKGDLSISISNANENVVSPQSGDSCPNYPGCSNSSSRDLQKCAIHKNHAPFSEVPEHDGVQESQLHESEIEEILMSLGMSNTTSDTALAQVNQNLACELRDNALEAFLENGDHSKSPENTQLARDISVMADSSSNSQDVIVLEEGNLPMRESISQFSSLGSDCLSFNDTSSLQGDSVPNEKHGSEEYRPPCQTSRKFEILNISGDVVSPSASKGAFVPSLEFTESLESLHDGGTSQFTGVSSVDQKPVGSPERSETELEARRPVSSRGSGFNSDSLKALIQAVKVCRQDLTIKKVNPVHLGDAGVPSVDNTGLEASDEICENDFSSIAQELNLSITFNPRLTVKKLPNTQEANPSSDVTRAMFTLTSKNLDSNSSSETVSPLKKLNRREISIHKFDELVIDNDEPSLNEPPELDRVECVSLKGVRFDIRPDCVSSIEDYLQRMLARKAAEQELKLDPHNKCSTPRKRQSPNLGEDEWVIDNDEPPLNPTPVKKARNSLVERTEMVEELEDLEIDNDMPSLNESIDKAKDDCLVISSDDEPSVPVVQSKPPAVTDVTPASRPVRKKMTKKRRKVLSSHSNGSMDEKLVFIHDIPNVGQTEERDPLSWFVNDMIEEVADPLKIPSDALPSIQSSREVLCQPQVFNLQGQPLLRFDASNTLTTSNPFVPFNPISSPQVTFDLSQTLNRVQSPESPNSDTDIILLSPSSSTTYSNNSLVDKSNDCDSELVEDSDDDVILLTDNVPKDIRRRPNVERPVANTSSGCVDLRHPPNGNLYITSATPLQMRRVANSDGSSNYVLVIPTNTHFPPTVVTHRSKDVKADQSFC